MINHTPTTPKMKPLFLRTNPVAMKSFRLSAYQPTKRVGQKRWGLTLLGVLLSLLVGSTLTHAQQLPAPTVIVEYGATEALRTRLSQKTEEILGAINRYQINGEDQFPDEPGIPALKALIASETLVATFDTLGTGAIENGSNYELSRLLLTPREGEIFDYQELVFVYNRQAELQQVRRGKAEHNIDRILGREIALSAQEEARVERFLARFEQVFEEQESEALNTLFDTEAMIVVGAKPRGSQTFVFTRYDRDRYVSRLQSRTLVPSNRIDIRMTETRSYRHPDLPGVLGVTMKQDWNSTVYSDVGYLFLVVDFRQDTPVILLRQWQEEPFIASSFSNILPDPFMVQAYLKRVERADSMGISEGRLIIEPSGDMSPEKALASYRSGQFRLQGEVKIKEEGIEQTQKGLLIPFEMNEASYTPRATVTFIFEESGRYEGMETTLPVFAQCTTVVALRAEQTLLSPPLSASPLGVLTIELEQGEGAETQLLNAWNQALYRQTLALGDSLIRYEVLKGEYRFKASKPGYLPLDTVIAVERSYTQRFTLEQEPDTVVAAPVPVAAAQTGPGFWAKYKGWIIGGAAVVAGGTAAALLLSDDAQPGIPVPPGRPVGGN